MKFDFVAVEADMEFLLEALTCIQELVKPADTARDVAVNALCSAGLQKLWQQLPLVQTKIEAMREVGEDPGDGRNEHPF